MKEHSMVLTTIAVPVHTDVDRLEALRLILEGDVITPGHSDYESARSTLYGATRFPMAVVRVASTGHVVSAVNFARQHGVPLAVRSGGHSLARHSVIDGAVVVDFSSRSIPKPGSPVSRQERHPPILLVRQTGMDWRSRPATPIQSGSGG
jgi:hypothetical protein